jgi:ABC-type branched-subunit amino acid transport system substrate-binding protein
MDGMNARVTCLFLAVLLFGCLIPPLAHADDLQDARNALRRGRYESAITLALPLVEAADEDLSRQARLIVAGALVELDRFSEALAVLFPLMSGATPRAADADWIALLARVFQEQGLLLEAADWWLTLATLGSAARRRAEPEVQRLTQGPLSQEEIAYLLWKYPRNRLLCPAASSYAEREERTEHLREAIRARIAARRQCGEDPWESALSARYAETEAGAPADDFFTLGVLGPLNGPYARFGISLCHGINAARRGHNSRARFPLKLEIADTEGDPRECLAAVARLYRQGIRIFIGEIFSLNTLMAASFLKARNAILLSPAAIDSTVALLGPGTYGCTVGKDEQMRALATCAAESLGVRRVAMIWPDASAGRRWMRIFRRAARERGIAVSYEHAYQPGTTDFGELLESMTGRIHESIDAIFCPGEMRELVALLSHCAQAGFLGPFLGGPSMDAEVVAQVAREFGLLALYPTDARVAVNSAGTAEEFGLTYGQPVDEDVDAFAHSGWVAFRLIGEAVESGGYCPEALQEILEARCASDVERSGTRQVAVPRTLAVVRLFLLEGSRKRTLLPLPAGALESPADPFPERAPQD